MKIAKLLKLIIRLSGIQCGKTKETSEEGQLAGGRRDNETDDDDRRGRG